MFYFKTENQSSNTRDTNENNCNKYLNWIHVLVTGKTRLKLNMVTGVGTVVVSVYMCCNQSASSTSDL